MANEEHLAKLNEGVGAWNHWQRENPDDAPDLSHTNLECRDLRDINLFGAQLNGAKLREADLRHANLSYSNLCGAELTEANMDDANLVMADIRRGVMTSVSLQRANLLRADLVEADMFQANLQAANLHGASLEKANLRAADLWATSFNSALLRGADFTGAECSNTVFADTDLSETSGLDRVIHAGPSAIDMRTLSRSHANVPDEFLRGCGLSDWEVETAKLYKPDLSSGEKTDILYRIDHLLSDSPIQISPLFISYSWNDSEFVDNLGEKLDKLHILYWRDKKDATAGRLDKVIDRGIRLNPTLLVVLSKNSVNAPWVEYEVGKAVDLSRELERDVLCPIALDDSWAKSAQMSGHLRSQIKKYNVLIFEDWQNQDSFEQQMKKLIDGLNLHYRNRPNDSAEPGR